MNDTTGPKLRVGMFIPRAVMDEGARVWREVLRAMADAGIDHVGASDHVSFHTGWGVDGMVQATALASAEPRLAVCLGVYLLPLRHPVLVARQLSTFAIATHGRMEFGVGVGGEDRHEVEICGVDPRTRGRRMDESMIIISALLTGETLDFEGEFFTLEGARIVPVPAHPIPMVVGGRSPAALRRAGRFGDGWLAAWTTASRFGEGLAAVQAHAAAAGRAALVTRHGFQPWVGLGPDRDAARAAVAAPVEAMYQLPFERFERYCPYGTPQEIADFLQPYVHLGCTTLNLAPQTNDWHRAVDGVAEIRAILLAR